MRRMPFKMKGPPACVSRTEMISRSAVSWVFQARPGGLGDLELELRSMGTDAACP